MTPSTHTDGTNRITALIVDRNDVTIAHLSTCLSLQYTVVLNDTGAWTASFPARDPRLILLYPKKHYIHFYVDGQIVCYGMVETWKWGLNNDGQAVLNLAGRDSLAELDELSLATWVDEEFFGFNVPWHVVQEYNDLNGYTLGAVKEWTIAKQLADDAVFPLTDMAIQGVSVGESALRLLIRVAEYTGESFRLLQTGQLLLGHPIWSDPNPKRHVEWLGNIVTSSGVRAIGTLGEPARADENPLICFIQSFTERRDTSHMLTRIYSYGSGFGQTKMDLEGISAQAIAYIAAAGCAYNAEENYIWNPNAEIALGVAISRQVIFKDVRPLYNTEADIQAAKDYLAHVATAYLIRNDHIDDTLEYDLTVIRLPSHVKVGMTIRIIWQEDTRTIDGDFHILGIRMSVGSDGERTYVLTIATATQWRLRESSNIVSQMEEGQILGSHPQIDAVPYWKSYDLLIGDDQFDHMAEIPFFLGNEVVTVSQVVLRVRLEQPLVLTRTYAYANPSVEENAAVNTGESSEPQTLGVFPLGQLTGEETADVTGGVPGGTVMGDSPANTGDGEASTGFVVGTIALVISDEITGTGDPQPDSTTAINTAALSTLGAVSINPDMHIHNMTAHDHDFGHTHLHAHAHPGSMLPDHTHEAQHQHGMLHVHTFDHVHTFVHMHEMPHTHEMPHVHLSPVHQHELPDLLEAFVVERIPISLTYAQDELEYSVNGNEFLSLDVDNPLVIPSFGGYYQVDITPIVQKPGGLRRPWQEYNNIQVRRKGTAPAGKMARVRVELGIRVTVQSIVLYE